MSSHTEGVVKKKDGYIDTEHSSGDFNKMPNKSKPQCQEENNNEVDELSKDLSEMGCIVDAVKRPPNICVETCIYESESEHSGNEGIPENGENEEDNYSDSFEEDKSEEDIEPKLAKSETTNIANDKQDARQSNIKLSKSHSFMSSSKANVSVAGSKASTYGSLSVPRTTRINMSFTNERLREIERHNHILLTKIMTARNSRRSSIPSPVPPAPRRPPPSAAISRKRQQRQIDHENMILLRKIQRAKSSACSIRR